MNLDEKLEDALNKIGNKDELISFEDKFRDVNRIYDPGNAILIKEATIFPAQGTFDRPITIIPITDIHFGSKQTNLKKLNEILKFIEDTPDCYTILLGDQTETATKQSVGMGVYDEDVDLRSQLRVLSNLLRPLARKNKILGILTGNHEMRVAYATSINPAELLAEKLDVPYFGFQGYLIVKVGSQIYKIFAHHGVGGGCTPSGKLNAMRKLNQVALADIYMSGHTHGKLWDHDLIMEMDEETGIVKPKMRYYVVAGSFLEYWGGYAEMKLLPPSATGTIAMKLMHDKKEVRFIE